MVIENDLIRCGFDSEKGLCNSILIKQDQEQANFIKQGKGLFQPYKFPNHVYVDNVGWTRGFDNYRLESFSNESDKVIIVYECNGVKIREIFRLRKEDIVIDVQIFNTNFFPVYFQKEDLSFYFPFADSYDSTEICEKKRCHTHIATFLENSYIRLERMGQSPHNLGVLFTKGSFCSYSQEDCVSNDRGFFILNISPFHLLGGQHYDIQGIIFTHKGSDDFYKQIKKYKEYIHIQAKDGYTLFLNDIRELELTAGEDIKSVDIKCAGKHLPFKIDGRHITIPIKGDSLGEKIIYYEVNGRTGVANFFVSKTLEQLQDLRANFIIKHQQCLDKKSPLYGAYLIYDTEDKVQYFNYTYTDHNACRERMQISIFLARYLKKTGNKSVKKSIELFTEYMLRECVDEKTGQIYNNIGKGIAKRYYNAPWVMLFFCELYGFDGNNRWIELIIKIIELYYKEGGATFYSNIRFFKIAQTIKKSGNEKNYIKIVKLFDKHIDYLMANGTNYPACEVNFEQTIISSPAFLLLDKYLLSKDKKYLDQAKIHIDMLMKFNGNQPDYHLNKTPIRYWDNYWFGKTKNCSFGDTFPHSWTVLSAESFYLYGLITNNQEYIDYGRQEFENGYCLIFNDGRASSSYVYPEKVNGQKGKYYDSFANEQDAVLYFAEIINDSKDITDCL